MLRLLVGLLCLVLLAFLLAEFFIVFLLPWRVNRDPAIARGVLRILWVPWRATAKLLPREAADSPMRSVLAGSRTIPSRRRATGCPPLT